MTAASLNEDNPLAFKEAFDRVMGSGNNLRRRFGLQTSSSSGQITIIFGEIKKKMKEDESGEHAKYDRGRPSYWAPRLKSSVTHRGNGVQMRL